MSYVLATTRDKGGVDGAMLDNNWGIRIESAKRTRLVTTQRGMKMMIHPSLTKQFNTNDRQLRKIMPARLVDIQISP
jgi:hypothetical protein